jgi:hypothetical protein
MPVDQHELIALIAPRPVYLSTASEDQWSDPKGEFLAALAAGPVYRLLGKQGLDTDRMPPLDTPIVHTIAFHTHTGKHEITDFDWEQYLAFADMHLKIEPIADGAYKPTARRRRMQIRPGEYWMARVYPPY